MDKPERSVCAALQYLLEASHLSGPDDLARLTRAAGAFIGAADAVVYVVDYDQVALVPVRDRESTAAAEVPISGTMAGRAFTEVRARRLEQPGGALKAWYPVLDGSERLGVLELTFPDDVTDDLMKGCHLLAALLAELLITRGEYGDAIERLRRRLPMSLPAELQWRLLPPLTFATPRLAISGILLPTNAVAGDTFDYAVNGDTAHLAVLDAMGHGLEALLLSSVAIGALRNARRSGLNLFDAVRSVDKHLNAQFGDDKFVTGIVGELNVATGVYRWITCGHPPALLLRGGRVVKTLSQVTDFPLGLLHDRPEIGEERLQRGDRLLLYTDGVTEARDHAGEFFGVRRLVDLVSREAAAGRPAPETLRRLNLAILAHQEGMLQDDATTLLVEWSGVGPERVTPAG